MLPASALGTSGSSISANSGAQVGLSASSVAYQYVGLNNTASQAIALTSTGTQPVTINSVTASGSGFSVSGVTLPLTLKAGQTATMIAQFAPKVAGNASGQVTLVSNSTSNPTATVALSGIGGVPPLSSFYCVTGSPVGETTNICTVKFAGASPSASFPVSILSSNSAGVTVPATVTVAANSSMAQFTTNVHIVPTAQTVTLTATAGGTTMTSPVALVPYTSTLGLSASSVAYQYVGLNNAASQAITLTSTGTQPLTISSVAASGTGFSVSGVTLPLTLKPGQTATMTAKFAPAVAGNASGQITVLSNSTSNKTATVSLSGIGGIPPMSSFYCVTGSPVGETTNICTVKFSGLSPSASFPVSVLSSSSAAVTVPATVTVAANTSMAQFTTNVHVVSTAQTVTLTATAGSTKMTSPVTLVPSTSSLGLSASSLTYQYVGLNSAATQSVTLSSTGKQAVTINSLTATGTGFSVSGVTLPLTLKPGQTAAMTVQFAPTVAGNASGQINVVSTSTTNRTATVTLSGIGGPPPISSFYCVTGSPIGETTDICTVKLTGLSPSGPVAVNLSSSSAAVTVPAIVSVPANSNVVQFTANVHTVPAAQTVTLTATAGTSKMTSPLGLAAYVSTLGVNRTIVDFSSVQVESRPTQWVTLTSTGTAPVTISAASETGAAFSISGLSLPVTLNPGQTASMLVQFAPTSAGLAVGVVTVASNSSAGSVSKIALTGYGLSNNGAGAATPFNYTDSPVADRFGPSDASALISKDNFGMTIFNLTPNSLYDAPNMTPFPDFSVSTLRGISFWRRVDSYKGQNNWTQTDKTIQIAAAHGTSDIIYTFSQTPQWASTNPTEPCTGGDGPGTCVSPKMDELEAFATKLVQRYCGKIKYYEPWNEPDNPQFWVGTNSQLLDISRTIYRVVKDPANCGCTDGTCRPGGGANPNSVLLPSISNSIDGYGLKWLQSYLADAGGSYPYADVATFHGYLWPGAAPENMVSGVKQLKTILQTNGMGSLPLWNTEGSWETNNAFTDQQQADWVLRYHTMLSALGVNRTLWFSYDNCSWGTLYASPLCNNPAVAPAAVGKVTTAGSAYATMEQWLIGSNVKQCVRYQNGLWICQIQKSGGYNGYILWTTSAKNVVVGVPSELAITASHDPSNAERGVGTQITISQTPTLLANQN